jgi:hypothetical protein
MIGGLKKVNGDPSSTVDYIFLEKGGTGRIRGELLGGTLLEVTREDIATALSALRTRRPDLARPLIHHAWASVPEGEALSAEQWLHVGGLLAEKLGWKAWVAVRHSDTAHDHTHFLGSVVGADGTCSREYLRDWRLVRGCHA